MGQTYVLTGDIGELLGEDIKQTSAYVRTNLASGTALIDTTATANSVRLGTGRVELVNGSFSVPLLGTANTGLNVAPNTLRYEVVVEYVDAGSKVRRTWSSGMFPLTANTDLKNVVPDAEPIAVASSSQYALEAKEYRDQAAEIAGLDNVEAAVATALAGATFDGGTP